MSLKKCTTIFDRDDAETYERRHVKSTDKHHAQLFHENLSNNANCQLMCIEEDLMGECIRYMTYI